MSNQKEIDGQSMALSNVKINSTEFVVKLMLLRRGPPKEFKSGFKKGIRMQLIFVDEEGTKIQSTIFGKQIEQWGAVLEPLKCYFISNGKIIVPNEKFLNVNIHMELLITGYTSIKVCTEDFSTKEFSSGFSTLDTIPYAVDNRMLDVVGILLRSRGIVHSADTVRQELLITDQRNNCRTVVLWGDYAKNDGATLLQAASSKPVVAFCNMRPNNFNGNIGVKSTGVTSVLVHPVFEEANALKNWYSEMVSSGTDITLMATMQMKRSVEMKLTDILDDKLDNDKNVFVRFNARIVEVENKTHIWYSSCKSCSRKVTQPESDGSCPYCHAHNAEFENRYFVMLKIEVDDVKEIVDKDLDDNSSTSKVVNEIENEPLAQPTTITVKLFDAARFLLRCDVSTYIQQLHEKEHDSEYYKNMLNCEGKIFTFMIMNYHSIKKDKRTTGLIIEEMHQLEVAAIFDSDCCSQSLEPIMKRSAEDAEIDKTKKNAFRKKKK